MTSRLIRRLTRMIEQLEEFNTFAASNLAPLPPNLYSSAASNIDNRLRDLEQATKRLHELYISELSAAYRQILAKYAATEIYEFDNTPAASHRPAASAPTLPPPKLTASLEEDQ